MGVFRKSIWGFFLVPMLALGEPAQLSDHPHLLDFLQRYYSDPSRDALLLAPPTREEGERLQRLADYVATLESSAFKSLSGFSKKMNPANNNSTIFSFPPVGSRPSSLQFTQVNPAEMFLDQSFPMERIKELPSPVVLALPGVKLFRLSALGVPSSYLAMVPTTVNGKTYPMVFIGDSNLNTDEVHALLQHVGEMEKSDSVMIHPKRLPQVSVSESNSHWLDEAKPRRSMTELPHDKVKKISASQRVMVRGWESSGMILRNRNQPDAHIEELEMAPSLLIPLKVLTEHSPVPGKKQPGTLKGKPAEITDEEQMVRELPTDILVSEKIHGALVEAGSPFAAQERSRLHAYWKISAADMKVHRDRVEIAIPRIMTSIHEHYALRELEDFQRAIHFLPKQSLFTALKQIRPETNEFRRFYLVNAALMEANTRDLVDWLKSDSGTAEMNRFIANLSNFSLDSQSWLDWLNDTFQSHELLQETEFARTAKVLKHLYTLLQSPAPDEGQVSRLLSALPGEVRTSLVVRRSLHDALGGRHATTLLAYLKRDLDAHDLAFLNGARGEEMFYNSGGFLDRENVESLRPLLHKVPRLVERVDPQFASRLQILKQRERSEAFSHCWQRTRKIAGYSGAALAGGGITWAGLRAYDEYGAYRENVNRRSNVLKERLKQSQVVILSPGPLSIQQAHNLYKRLNEVESLIKVADRADDPAIASQTLDKALEKLLEVSNHEDFKTALKSLNRPASQK